MKIRGHLSRVGWKRFTGERYDPIADSHSRLGLFVRVHFIRGSTGEAIRVSGRDVILIEHRHLAKEERVEIHIYRELDEGMAVHDPFSKLPVMNGFQGFFRDLLA